MGIRQYLQSSQLSSSGPLPLLNTLFIENSSEWDTLAGQQDFKTFMKWARRSPQVMGFGNIVATDILSDDINWKANDRGSGRNRIKASQEFWAANSGEDVLEQSIYDCLFCGLAYNWVGKLDEAKIKAAIKKSMDETYGSDKGDVEKREFLEYRAQELFEKATNGEISSLAKKFRHIPATTVSIKNNEYEITEYVQRVGTKFKRFKPDEVIVFRLMPLDGKPYPFAPMEAILAEVYLLWLISQNYVSYFENGGSPDKAFILPKEIAGSQNHNYLINTLKKYKKIQNKHGNLVFTGELKVEDLMKFEAQMEHRELGLYLVGVLAMLWGVPVSRIPFLIGKAANNGDSGGLADSGYWRKISVWQSKFERGYNRSIFTPYFGTTMQFSRQYKQDEVRETTIEMQKTQIAEQRINLGVWTLERAGEYLGIDPEDVEQAIAEKKQRDQEAMDAETGMLRQNLLAKKSVMPESDAQKKAATKKNTQNNNKIGAPPMGV